jgi:hypothetical protein
MGYPKRIKWLEGRYSNVDGIPFEMPVRTRTSPALWGIFTIDGARAEEMLPGEELHAWQMRGRGLLVIAVVNYLDTTIGTYVEFCIGVLVTHGRKPHGRILPLILRSRYGTGVYIYDLPVSTEISVKGGLGIWGMPKRQASLDFHIGPDIVSSQYDLDGQLVARIDVPRPKRSWVPIRMNGIGWGADFRGLLTKSYIYARGGHSGVRIRPHRARLVLGDHPRADALKQLDINPRPVATGFVPRMDAVLDDHVESWYLTAADPPGAPAVGLADVAQLSLSQQWLNPPERARVDAPADSGGTDTRSANEVESEPSRS